MPVRLVQKLSHLYYLYWPRMIPRGVTQRNSKSALQKSLTFIKLPGYVANPNYSMVAAGSAHKILTENIA